MNPGGASRSGGAAASLLRIRRTCRKRYRCSSVADVGAPATGRVLVCPLGWPCSKSSGKLVWPHPLIQVNPPAIPHSARLQYDRRRNRSNDSPRPGPRPICGVDASEALRRPFAAFCFQPTIVPTGHRWWRSGRQLTAAQGGADRRSAKNRGRANGSIARSADWPHEEVLSRQIAFAAEARGRAPCA